MRRTIVKKVWESVPKPLTALLLAVALLCTGCGPKGADAAFEPCGISPWGEKQMAEFAADRVLPPIPDNLGSTEDAIQRYKDNPENERERLRLGVAYFRDENYDEALPLLSHDYIDNDIKGVAGLYLGFLYIRRYEYVKGADQLELITLNHPDPDKRSAYSSFAGLIYSEHCMHQEAIAHLERALAIDSDDIYQWVQLGWNYGGLGDYERAREVFAQTLQAIADGTKADPHDIAELDAYSGFVEWNAGNTQAAKSHFEEALKSPHAPPSARHALDALNAGSQPFYARW